MLVHRFKDRESGLEVELSEDTLKCMLSHCSLFGELETGGVLAGYYDDTQKKAVILSSSTAPTDSQHNRTRFYRGVEGLKEWLSNLWQKEKAYYLGEWHFHPFSSSKMSSIDVKQMNAISTNQLMNCPEPIMIIIGGDPKQKYSVSVSLFMKGKETIQLKEYKAEYI
ncbi:hypothetical protein D3C73_374080 [compost metagenome]